MKVILYVFSGTGNTMKVAALYKKFLENPHKDLNAGADSKSAPASVDI